MSIPTSDLNAMLEIGTQAARCAGRRALTELQCAQRSVKNGMELVTQADPICQELIINTIRTRYPGHGFIAEEGEHGKLLKQLPAGGEDVWWVIDPIDGTNNYANGLLCFCICVAAMSQGRPILGIIYDPVADTLFTAVEGGPALLNGSVIRVSGEPICKFSSFGVDSHRNPAIEPGISSIMERTRFRCLGSTALHMAYVANGAMIGMAANTAKLWDICAGYVLIQQAGGIVIRQDGSDVFPLPENAYWGEPIPIIAAANTVFPEIRKILIGK